MKAIKVLAASAAALTLISSANAATFRVYITGSTAFRGPAQNSLQALYGAPLAQSNATLTSADAALYRKADYPNPGDTTFVKVSFAGSAAGIQTVAGSIPIPFYGDNTTGTVPVSTGTPDNHAPDIAFSDTYQGTTPFTDGIYEDLSAQDEIVGVVTFKFVGSKNFPTNGTELYNMTPQIAQSLFVLGKVPLSLFTGLAADKTRLVFATGRNPDSGTRLTAFAESGVGAGSTVRQWKPTVSAGAVTSQALYPVEVINGQSTNFPGNSGEASGSVLRNNLTATIPPSVYNTPAMGGRATTTGAFYVSYLGTGDAASVAANTTELKYNGVQFSETAVQQGQYTFWGYQHVMFRAAAESTVRIVATDLKAQILSATVSPNVKISDMVVDRAVDGGIITPLFSF
ncbi:MAG: hypothetical protein V4710_06010 [Verrucomicrobiota bacterium]